MTAAEMRAAGASTPRIPAEAAFASVRRPCEHVFAESTADSTVRSEARTVQSAVEIAAESEAIVKQRYQHPACTEWRG